MRNINGVPVKKWEPSKCKTVILYNSVTAFWIHLLRLNILSYKTNHIAHNYLAPCDSCRHAQPHSQTHTHPKGQLTPANAQVDFEVVPLCEHSDDQEVVEVDAFHKQPVTVGHDAVLHHHHGDATANCHLQESSEVHSQMKKTWSCLMLNIIPLWVVHVVMLVLLLQMGAPSATAGILALCRRPWDCTTAATLTPASASCDPKHTSESTQHINPCPRPSTLLMHD